MRIQRQPEPMVLPCGLPEWAALALDGAIGSGTIRWASVDHLDTEELLQLAREIVARQLKPVNVPGVLAEIGGSR